jgi:hypothetical protein
LLVVCPSAEHVMMVFASKQPTVAFATQVWQRFSIASQSPMPHWTTRSNALCDALQRSRASPAHRC